MSTIERRTPGRVKWVVRTTPGVPGSRFVLQQEYLVEVLENLVPISSTLEWTDVEVEGGAPGSPGGAPEQP